MKIKSSSLKSSFYIDKNYVNIIEESCNDLLLNITECLNIEFQISVRISNFIGKLELNLFIVVVLSSILFTLKGHIMMLELCCISTNIPSY